MLENRQDLASLDERFQVAMVLEEGKLGGPQIYVERLSSAAKDNVNTLIIIPEENSTKFIRLLSQSGLAYTTFNLTRVTKEFSVALRYLCFSGLEIYRLYKFFKLNRFDYIYAAGGAWQYKGLLAGKLSGHKVIWHQNDTQMPKLFRLIFSLLSGLADGYVYASEKTRLYYQPLVRDKAGSKKHFVIPSPVDTKYFSDRATFSGDEDLIASWAGKKVIGVVANINPIKGLDIFIKVAQKLNSRLDDLQFIVLGPINKNQSTYYSTLQDLCKQAEVRNLSFIGSRDDVRPILNRFDLYLCTSYAESSPISVWEAMSMAKPVVATDVGDVSVYLKQGVCGELAPVGDVDKLTVKAYKTLTNNKLAIQYGLQARRSVVENLDVQCCVEKHLSVYRKMSDII